MSSAPKKAAIFGVRFESYDDFLVEYGDHLRRGQLELPTNEGLELGEPVRIKLFLPDGKVLYLRGKVGSPPPADTQGLGTGRVLVELDSLKPSQQEDLENCVRGALSQPGEDNAGARSEPLNLLLVDDSVTVRLELGDALRERGCRVRVAENGLVAIAAALKRPPDIILSDVEMPVMDGWTFLRMARARERLAPIPVVFFTRLNDDLSRLQGYRMGVEDYLAKETSPDEILARLQAVLTRRARSQAIASAQGLRGDLQHVRLGSLLSFLETERRSGFLTLNPGRGRREASVVHIVEGAIEEIEGLGDFARREDRVFDLLDWTEGEFEFVSVPSDAANSEEALKITYLLMEHARRRDESGF